MYQQPISKMKSFKRRLSEFLEFIPTLRSEFKEALTFQMGAMKHTYDSDTLRPNGIMGFTAKVSRHHVRTVKQFERSMRYLEFIEKFYRQRIKNLPISLETQREKNRELVIKRNEALEKKSRPGVAQTGWNKPGFTRMESVPLSRNKRTGYEVAMDLYRKANKIQPVLKKAPKLSKRTIPAVSPEVKRQLDELHNKQYIGVNQGNLYPEILDPVIRKQLIVALRAEIGIDECNEINFLKGIYQSRRYAQ